MAKISHLPPTPINAKVRHDANVKTAQLDIAVAGVVRELLTAWANGDPRAEAIVNEAIARGAFVRKGPGKRIE